MSKEAYYFSHDANSRNDPKILAMRSEYGLQGYGMYWVIVEMLREQSEFKLPLKKYIWKAIAMQLDANALQVDPTEYAEQFINDCINEFDLFDSDGQHFWSNSLLRRMSKKNEVSEKRRAAAKKRWEKNKKDEEKSKTNANAMQKDTNAEQVDAIKGKERKGKESKVKQQQEGAPNDTAEIVQFWDNNGFGFNNTNAKLKLLDWLDEKQFIEAGPMILKAMDIASGANKRTLSYIEGILKRWYNHGCSTLADVDAYQAEFEQGQTQKQKDWEALASE